MSGNGDTPRPKSVPDEEYSRNWDAIFGRTPEPQEADTPGTD